MIEQVVYTNIQKIDKYVQVVFLSIPFTRDDYYC